MDNSLVPDLQDVLTAKRPLLPRPASGPFTVDVAGLFDQASRSVCSRRDLMEQLDMLQERPDLVAAISGQRQLVLSSVTDQAERLEKIGGRLRDLLVASMATEPEQVKAFEVLATGASVLRDAVRAIDDELSGSAEEPALPQRARLETRLRATQLYRTRLEGQLRSRGIRSLAQVTAVPVPEPERSAGSSLGQRPRLIEEQAACRRVLGEIERREAEMLEQQLPNAAGQLEFRALATEWESQQRDIVLMLESAMLSVALTALNSAMTAASASRMRVASFDGLRETLTGEKIVITAPFERLEAMIGQSRDGSFGIAGPRGAGKSTLIRFFVASQALRGQGSSPGSDATTVQRQRLGVVVSAPVQYDARDFVLYLYAELCKRVAGNDADETILWQRQLGRESGRRWWLPAAVSLGLVIFGAGATTAGVALTAWAIARRLRSPAHPLADLGAAAIAAAAVLLLFAAFRALNAATRGLRAAEFGRSASSLAGTGWPPGDIQNGLPAPAAWYWCCAAMSTLTVAGLSAMHAGGGWPGGAWGLAGGLALIAVGIPSLWAVLQSRRPAALSFAGSTVTLSGLKPSQDTQLRELALDRLRQIRFQQSFSTERAMTAKIGVPTRASLGFDMSGKRGTTWEERPKTYPELVADLRAFLAAAAEKYELIIGIDELDKLRSPQAVEDFLNDIKGVFGATGCFYLVSVSEDAAASFERRGTPFRDVFDSSFDDIISLPYLGLGSSRKILHGQLLGWTEPFIALCYTLPGGLARDLKRVARELVANRDADNAIELGQAVLDLCRREGEARLNAARHVLLHNPDAASNIDLLARIADLTFTEAGVNEFLNWHEELRSWGTCMSNGYLAAPDPVDPPAAPTPAPVASVEPASHLPIPVRLAQEMAAYLLFAATVLEFFVPELIGDRLHEARDADSRSKTLATLAAAQQSLALNPGESLACTRRFRQAWNL